VESIYFVEEITDACLWLLRSKRQFWGEGNVDSVNRKLVNRNQGLLFVMKIPIDLFHRTLGFR
jgi:hypothetical protein